MKTVDRNLSCYKLPLYSLFKLPTSCLKLHTIYLTVFKGLQWSFGCGGGEGDVSWLSSTFQKQCNSIVPEATEIGKCITFSSRIQ